MSAAQEFNQQIHRRLLARDPVASSELVEALLDPLVRHLRIRFREVRDKNLLQDAATDALLNYAERPDSFDPSRSSLLTYLSMSARGDLRNALERQRRRTGREISLVVELGDSLRNNLTAEDGSDPSLWFEASEADHALLARIRELVPEEQDRRLLALLMEGERKTESFSAVLGILHLEIAEQRRIVKRHKDRLKKRLQRLGDELHESPPES